MILSDCSAFATSEPRQNLLLAMLPDLTWIRWLAKLEAVELPLGKVLRNAGRSGDYVYFPTSATLSLQCITQDGGTSEIAVIGKEGVVGINVIMGGEPSAFQAVVQTAGQCFRLSAQAVAREFENAGPVLTLLLRYMQSVMTQVAQSAACNRYHSIDQQLSRRLLTAIDRSATSHVHMTHELAASLMGVRREGVTAAARKLQRAGVIRYARGDIVVLDRRGLEQRACECYATTRKSVENRSLSSSEKLYDQSNPLVAQVKAAKQPVTV